MKRVAPPPSDEQLASAEQTDTIRRRDRLAAIADQQEQERLAAAGEPTAQEALKAMASVLDSRPIGEEEPIDADSTPADRASPSKSPKTSRRRIQKRNEDSPSNNGRAASRPSPQQEEELDETRFEQTAYKLMDTAYRKWEKTARKDLKRANHDLALDLGKDAAIYFRSQIIRMADLHSTIDKLTASHKPAKDGVEESENFDDEMEEFRKQLRG